MRLRRSGAAELRGDAGPSARSGPPRRAEASPGETAIPTCGFGCPGIRAGLDHPLDWPRQKTYIGLEHGMAHAVHAEGPCRVLVEVPGDDVPEGCAHQQPV